MPDTASATPLQSIIPPMLVLFMIDWSHTVNWMWSSNCDLGFCTQRASHNLLLSTLLGAVDSGLKLIDSMECIAPSLPTWPSLTVKAVEALFSELSHPFIEFTKSLVLLTQQCRCDLTLWLSCSASDFIWPIHYELLITNTQQGLCDIVLHVAVFVANWLSKRPKELSLYQVCL